MNNITASLKKKIYLFLTLLIIGSIVIFSFGAEIDDWRRHLFSIGADSWQSASQIEIEIVREGVVVDSITSTLTNSLNLQGFPNDLVTVPPTINALVGDTIRIKDLSAPTPGAWDFQKYYNGSPYFTQQFFYGNSPFPYEETVTKTGDYTFYLNVYNNSSQVWSSYGDYRSVGVYKEPISQKEYPMWWYFTHLRVKVTDNPDPFVVVTGDVTPNPSTLENGKATIKINENAKIEEIRNGEKVESWELKVISADGSINLSKKFDPTSSLNVTNAFEDITITKSTTFALRATVKTNRGTFEGVTFVNAQIESDSSGSSGEPGEVKARGRIDAVAGSGYREQNGVAFLTYTYPEYRANIPKVVKIKIDGSESTSDPHSLSEYAFYLRKNSNSWSHPSSHVTDWMASRSTTVDLVVEPNDVNPDGRVNLNFRIGAKDTEGNTNYYNDNESIIWIEVIYRDPEVRILAPQLFLPKSFTDYSSIKNNVYWEYYSADELNLDHYEMTLKYIGNSEDGTLDYDDPQILLDKVVTTDEMLEIEGNENDVFVLEVTAYDVMGNSGNATLYAHISDMKAVAGFEVSGNKKMYKEVKLNGYDKTLELTNTYLHETLFQTDFESEKSYFTIEPIDTGLTLDDIKVVGKEIEDGKVVIKGNPKPSIRFDKSGNYKIGYTVWNGFKQSDIVYQEIFITPELFPSLVFSLDNPLVLRSPSNSLKAELGVSMMYSSFDDDIDTDKSELRLKYDANNDGNYDNDGEASNMFIRGNTISLIDGITLKAKSLTQKDGFFTFVVDNINKNFLGRILFDFIVVEKPRIPNYEAPPEVPIVPDITADTFSMDKAVKTILIDNNAPDFSLSISSEGNVEIWFLEAGGVDFDTASVLAIRDSLKFYGITATIYYEDGGAMKTITT